MFGAEGERGLLIASTTSVKLSSVFRITSNLTKEGGEGNSAEILLAGFLQA